ncbi:transposase [Kitasatospora xanthocidica]|uniref:transposase n=1 Tax=Kitasatospora xanthocidica TaxID=83382 RepID=UPI0036ECF04E
MRAGELAVWRGRLEEFAAEVFAPLARCDQRAKGGLCLRGLLLEGRRKSMQPMAERLGFDHQRLQQFMTSSTWPVEDVRVRLARRAVRAVRPEVWAVDDTGFPKGRIDVPVLVPLADDLVSGLLGPNPESAVLVDGGGQVHVSDLAAFEFHAALDGVRPLPDLEGRDRTGGPAGECANCHGCSTPDDLVSDWDLLVQVEGPVAELGSGQRSGYGRSGRRPIGIGHRCCLGARPDCGCTVIGYQSDLARVGHRFGDYDALFGVLLGIAECGGRHGLGEAEPVDGERLAVHPRGDMDLLSGFFVGLGCGLLHSGPGRKNRGQGCGQFVGLRPGSTLHAPG